jgi:CRP/FNR family transcriptional regulator, cyclic AMP receptor protein
MRGLDELIAESPALSGLSPAQAELIAGCARNVHFAPGATIAREGDAADQFFLLRHGAVALELTVPGRSPLTIETVGSGEIVGWSWLFEPHRWQFDVVALEDVSAIVFDGACLRGKCDADHELGYELMRRFAGLLLTRLQHTRLQLLDVYGRPVAS